MKQNINLVYCIFFFNIIFTFMLFRERFNQKYSIQKKKQLFLIFLFKANFTIILRFEIKVKQNNMKKKY